ncbi:MAG: sensor histidine kinase [Nostocoides sp.]
MDLSEAQDTTETRDRGWVSRRLTLLPLRVRLVAVVSVLVAAAVTLMTVATAYLMQQDLRARIDDELRSAAAPVAKEVFSGLAQGTNTVPTAYAVFFIPTGSSPIQVSTPTGATHSPAVPALGLDDPQVLTGNPFTVASTDSDDTWRVIAGRLTNGAGAYAVALPLEGSEHTVHRLLVISTLIGGVLLLACAVIGWYAVRRAFRPLTRIEDTAAAIAEGDLGKRVPVPHTHDEVQSLARSLNVMLGQIEHSFARQEASQTRMRQFVADASHELRTPLATVRGYAELYRQGAVRGEPAVTEAMGRIEREATRMNGLVQDLLTLARLDEEPEVTFHRVDLLELAVEVVKDARVRAPDRQIELTGLQGPFGPLPVHGNGNQLRQVLTNLLTNAIVHTPAGTPIEVVLGLTEPDEAPATQEQEPAGIAVVQVRDHGAGIPPQAAGALFERFYRADKARSRERGGTGLGLAIVAAIITAHHGQVAVAPTSGGGATFVIELPTAESQPAPIRC